LKYRLCLFDPTTLEVLHYVQCHINSIQQYKGEVIITSPFLIFSIQKEISGQLKRNQNNDAKFEKESCETEYLMYYKGINNNMHHKMQRL
jgi:hypothetical protein